MSIFIKILSIILYYYAKLHVIKTIYKSDIYYTRNVSASISSIILQHVGDGYIYTFKK